MTSTDDITKYLQDLTLTNVLRLDHELGRGAYGVVFTVKYRETEYAAKEIHSSLTQSANENEKQIMKKNFLRECYYCSKICHPNIISFKGVYFPDQGSLLPILVMELMHDTLNNYVKKQELNVMAKVSILRDVSCGLSYLHGCDPPIIHRDLSPNNILMSSKSVAKISDLGVAKVVKPESQGIRSLLTKVPGTLHFMPLEALEDDPQYSTSLDIFSYGGIVLHVVNQEWPTPSNLVIRNPQTNELTAFTEVERRQNYLDKIEGAAEVLKPLVIDCLNNDPTKRPASETVLKIMEFLMVSFIIILMTQCV